MALRLVQITTRPKQNLPFNESAYGWFLRPEKAKMITHESSSNTVSVILKTSPPWAAVAANTIFGMTLNDWVMLLALIYTALQIVVLIRKEFIRRRSSND